MKKFLAQHKAPLILSVIVVVVVFGVFRLTGGSGKGSDPDRSRPS